MISIKDIKKVIDKRAKWIVKDSNGEILWHVAKPSKKSTIWYSPSLIGSLGFIEVVELQGKDWEDCCLPLPENEEPDWEYIIKNKCLCWFWDSNFNWAMCGTLGQIEKGVEYEFTMFDEAGNRSAFKHCRPVRRDEVTFYEEK